MPDEQQIKLLVEQVKTEQASAVKKVLTQIEEFTNYYKLEENIRDHIRMTVLSQFAGLFNKFLPVLEKFGPEYKCRRMERRHSVPPKASSIMGGPNKSTGVDE